MVVRVTKKNTSHFENLRRGRVYGRRKNGNPRKVEDAKLLEASMSQNVAQAKLTAHEVPYAIPAVQSTPFPVPEPADSKGIPWPKLPGSNVLPIHSIVEVAIVAEDSSTNFNIAHAKILEIKEVDNSDKLVLMAWYWRRPDVQYALKHFPQYLSAKWPKPSKEILCCCFDVIYYPTINRVLSDNKQETICQDKIFGLGSTNYKIFSETDIENPKQGSKPEVLTSMRELWNGTMRKCS